MAEPLIEEGKWPKHLCGNGRYLSHKRGNIMDTALSLISGACWTIVYVEIIRLGFKEKTYGMPLFALALNISWECVHAYLYLSTNPGSIQGWINLLWFLFDIVIVITYIKYGKSDFSRFCDPKYFIPWSLLALVMSFSVQVAFVAEFGEMGAGYSAFLQNLLMSVLFIAMLCVRKGGKGQSLLIAICKWLGTLAPTIMAGIIHGYVLLLILGIFCSVFDIMYIFMLGRSKMRLRTRNG
jgi:hypothetical protein